jgi:uncharacterized membrane protein
LAKGNRNRRGIAQRPPDGTRGGQVLTQQISVSGPLPASIELQNYENILPGLADRIVSQFEAEGTHRRYMEKRYLNLQALGLGLGSILYLIWIGASFIMIMTGHQVEGAVSGIVAIGALMTNTLIGYRRRHS